MSDATKIEWTHRPGTKGCTWNPIRAENPDTGKLGWYCEHASEGCRNCYAERLNRKPGATGGTGLTYKPGHRAGSEPNVKVFLDESTLVKPGHWRAPRTIFVCSMTDLFADFVPDTWLDKIFAVAALCPQHTFIMLTKRPTRMSAYLRHDEANLWQALRMRWFDAGQEICPDRAIPLHFIGRCSIYPLPNVWLGVTTEDQPNADARLSLLQLTPAALRFISGEPMLGSIDLHGRLAPWQNDPFTKDAFDNGHAPTPGQAGLINWVICGGETGEKARPMHPDWARSLRDQCRAANVPFFFKQWGEWKPCTGVDVYCHGPTKNRREFPNAEGIAWLNDGRICLRDFSVAEHKRRMAENIAYSDRAIEVDEAALRDFHASVKDQHRAIDNPLGLEWMYRAGKARSGRLLDSREHSEWPETRP